ncbi:MAG: DUF4129 domain-containing protein [Chloroflexota bacterium]
MRTWLLAGLCLLWLFAALPGASAQEATLTLEEYWALIDRSLESLSQLDRETPAAPRPLLEELATAWEAVRTVTLPDGQTVTVDSSRLIAQLRREPADLDQLRQSFQALKEAQQDAPFAFDDGDARSIEPILAQPEFQWQEAVRSPFQEWSDRFFAWLNELLNKLFGIQDIAAGTASPATILLSFFAVLVFAALSFFVLRDLFTALVTESDLAGEDEAGAIPLNAESALRRAQELSRGGDYRSAVRYLYLSSLLLLEERGLLRYDRSKTNREVLRSVSDQPELKKPLQNVVEVFDQVWYGYQELEPSDYERYEADVRQIKEQRS